MNVIIRREEVYWLTNELKDKASCQIKCNREMQRGSKKPTLSFCRLLLGIFCHNWKINWCLLEITW